MNDHPEDICQRCGGANPVWFVDSDRYNMAVNRSEIVCPSCFVAAHERATGMSTLWELRPAQPFRWIDDEGRPTPYAERDEVERLRAALERIAAGVAYSTLPRQLQEMARAALSCDGGAA